jgi:hypothetical protein
MALSSNITQITGSGISSTSTINVTAIAGIITATTLSVTGNITGDVAFSTTTQIKIPAGTTAERPGSPAAGMIRYNTENAQFEGYATAWGGFGGASGASGNAVFYENDTSVTANYTITSGKNAMSAGPVTIDSGVVVTVPSGSVWTVV